MSQRNIKKDAAKIANDMAWAVDVANVLVKVKKGADSGDSISLSADEAKTLIKMLQVLRQGPSEK
jgi:hypothetical protein